MVPGSGCGRIAQLTKIEAEIHAVSRVLQAALDNEDFPHTSDRTQETDGNIEAEPARKSLSD